MTTAVTSMGTSTKRAMTKRSRASSMALRVAAAGVVVCIGAMFTVADPLLTRSSDSAMVPSLATAAALPAMQGSTPAAEAAGDSGRMPLIVRFTRPMAAASLSTQSVTLVGPTGAEQIRVLPLGNLAIEPCVPGSVHASKRALADLGDDAQ